MHGPFEGPAFSAEARRQSLTGEPSSVPSSKPSKAKHFRAEVDSRSDRSGASPRIGSGSSRDPSGTPSSFAIDLPRRPSFTTSEFDSDGGSADVRSPSDTSSHPSLSPLSSVSVALPSLVISPPSIDPGQSAEEFTRNHFASFESSADPEMEQMVSSSMPTFASSYAQPHIPTAFSFTSSSAYGPYYQSTSGFPMPSFAPSRPRPADFYHPHSFDSPQPSAGPSTPRPTPRYNHSLPAHLNRPRRESPRYHNATGSDPQPRLLKPSYLSAPSASTEMVTEETEPVTLGAYYLNAFRMETENGLPSPFIRRPNQSSHSTTSAVMNYRPGEVTGHSKPIQPPQQPVQPVSATGQHPFELHLGGGLHHRRAVTHPVMNSQEGWFSFS